MHAQPLEALKVDCSVYFSGSESAGAYVRLVKHYLDQSDYSNDVLFKMLLEAENPINPFDNSKDSMAVQMRPAFKSVVENLNSKDWKEIKKALAEISQEQKVKRVDRHDKEHNTRLVFSPKIVDSKKVQDGFLSEPKWYLFEGRIFVAVAWHNPPKKLSGQIFIYELIDDRLVEFARIGKDAPAYSSVAWHEVDGHLYFAFAGQDKKLHLYEIKNKNLNHIQSVEMASFDGSAPIWKTIGAKTYLVFNDSNSTIHLYELVKGRLKYLNQLKVSRNNNFDLKWYSVKGHEYIALLATDTKGFDDNPIHELTINLVELKNNDELVLADSVSVESQDSDFVHYSQLENNRAFVAGFYESDAFRMYEIVDGRLLELKNAGPSKVFSGNGAKKNLAFSSAYNMQAVGFELYNDHFFEHHFNVGPFNIRGLEFREINNQYLFARVADPSAVSIGAWDGHQFDESWSAVIKANVVLPPVWIQRNDEHYVVVSGGKTLTLIKVFKDAARAK